MTQFKERMLMSAKEKRSRLVLALDVSGPIEERLAKAQMVLEQTKQDLAAVKLNQHLLLPYGLNGVKSLIAECRGEGLPLIADLKMNDIESTNLDALQSLISFGVDGLIANPFVGYEEGLGKVIERAHKAALGVLLLAYMSHQGAEDGYALRSDKGEPLYRVFASRAREWGADGVVVSAKSSDKILEVRRIVGKHCLLFSPGIGPQGGRASTALASGTDFIIVGRSVTEAPNPAVAVSALRNEWSK
jgi:orotidine-5'-phosphate decarboxylase